MYVNSREGPVARLFRLRVMRQETVMPFLFKTKKREDRNRKAENGKVVGLYNARNSNHCR